MDHTLKYFNKIKLKNVNNDEWLVATVLDGAELNDNSTTVADGIIGVTIVNTCI